MSWKRLLGFAFLVLCVMVGLLVLSVRSYFNHELQTQVAAIKAKGQPVTMAELLGPKIADSENAAIIYERAISKLKNAPTFRDTGDKTTDSESEIISDFFSNEKHSTRPEIMGKARQLIQSRKEVFTLLDQATSLPKSRFSVNWNGPSLPIMPQLPQLREFARLCSVRAILCAKDGQMDQAVHSIDVCLKIGESQSDEPSDINQLVRYAIYDMSVGGLRRVLNYGDLNYQQAEHLFQTLSRIDLDTGYTNALEGDRIGMMRDWSLFKNGYMSAYSDKDDMSSSDITTEPSPPSLRQALKWRLLDFVYANVVWQGDEAIYLARIGKQIDGAKLSYKEMKSHGLLDTSPIFPGYAVMSKGDLYFRPRFNMVRFRFKGQVSSDMISLALLAYKSRFGSYPQKLDDIKTRLGWTLPKDPYSGNDFFYKVEKNGFVVYSVGPNMKDDGGVQKCNYLAEDEPGDYVWKWDK